MTILSGERNNEIKIRLIDALQVSFLFGAFGFSVL